MTFLIYVRTLNYPAAQIKALHNGLVSCHKLFIPVETFLMDLSSNCSMLALQANFFTMRTYIYVLKCTSMWDIPQNSKMVHLMLWSATFIIIWMFETILFLFRTKMLVMGQLLLYRTKILLFCTNQRARKMQWPDMYLHHKCATLKSTLC